MSVIIKDMEMPKNCLECVMYDYYYRPGGCVLYSLGLPGRYNYDASKRPEWCELVEVPETTRKRLSVVNCFCKECEWNDGNGSCNCSGSIEIDQTCCCNSYEERYEEEDDEL